MKDRIVGAQQAGLRLGVHKQTVKRWAREGKLAGTRTFGGHWRFSEAEIDRVIAQRANSTETEAAAS